MYLAYIKNYFSNKIKKKLEFGVLIFPLAVGRFFVFNVTALSS